MCACRNADVSNTFKVDLHALHVDEALYEVEKCIKDLSKFKCECLNYLFDASSCAELYALWPVRILLSIENPAVKCSSW